jgi:hypothetical protein
VACNASGYGANLYSANSLVAFVCELLNYSCAAAISFCTKTHTYALENLHVRADKVLTFYCATGLVEFVCEDLKHSCGLQ